MTTWYLNSPRRPRLKHHVCFEKYSMKIPLVSNIFSASLHTRTRPFHQWQWDGMAMGFGAPKSYKQASGFMSTSNVDANLQGLRRSVVPYLIPFATLPHGFNEAYSQMVLNCLVQTCWPQSMAIVPFVRRKNEAHRRQKSDRMTFDGVDTIIKSQYTTKNFSACPHITSAAGLRQLSDVTKSYDSVVELDKHIPTHAADDCSFLVRRFEAWREKVVSMSPVGVV